MNQNEPRTRSDEPLGLTDEISPPWDLMRRQPSSWRIASFLLPSAWALLPPVAGAMFLVQNEAQHWKSVLGWSLCVLGPCIVLIAASMLEEKSLDPSQKGMWFRVFPLTALHVFFAGYLWSEGIPRGFVYGMAHGSISLAHSLTWILVGSARFDRAQAFYAWPSPPSPSDLRTITEGAGGNWEHANDRLQIGRLAQISLAKGDGRFEVHGVRHHDSVEARLLWRASDGGVGDPWTSSSRLPRWPSRILLRKMGLLPNLQNIRQVGAYLVESFLSSEQE